MSIDNETYRNMTPEQKYSDGMGGVIKGPDGQIYKPEFVPTGPKSRLHDLTAAYHDHTTYVNRMLENIEPTPENVFLIIRLEELKDMYQARKTQVNGATPKSLQTNGVSKTPPRLPAAAGVR